MWLVESPAAAVVRLGAWMAVLALAAPALAQAEEADEARRRRNTFTLEPSMLVGGLPPIADLGGIYQYQRVVSPRLSWLAGLKVRLTTAPLGGEQMAAFEGAGGARYFPGGSAPEGFHLGGHASLGFGHWIYRTSTLFGGEERIVDEGDGLTWSTVGQLGYQWISRGGFAFGLHFDVGAGTTSLREGRSGLLAGVGYSIGGAW